MQLASIHAISIRCRSFVRRAQHIPCDSRQERAALEALSSDWLRSSRSISND
ncbi:hypothetical protein HG438_002455 [Candidatus Saccharibacteria bacterium]|nr:hypothetical protein [Candidatus Saccharibacteria bacterium]